MLIASNFILNRFLTYVLFTNHMLFRSTKKDQFTLYPYIHQTANVINDKDQTRPIHVPDIVPSNELPSDADFSMIAGDFVEIYKPQVGKILTLSSSDKI
jgi:carnosine N-methyltransferase